MSRAPAPAAARSSPRRASVFGLGVLLASASRGCPGPGCCAWEGPCLRLRASARSAAAPRQGALIWRGLLDNCSGIPGAGAHNCAAMNDAPHSAPALAQPAPLALPPAPLAPPPAQLAPPHPSLPPPAQALPLATHLALAHAAAAAAPGGLAFYGLPPPQPGLAPLALPAPSGVTGQVGIPVGMDNAYLPGLTKSGKRRRKHPVAEVKGQWTAEEDERLIRCAAALSGT